jgi:hypothetical protein
MMKRPRVECRVAPVRAGGGTIDRTTRDIKTFVARGIEEAGHIARTHVFVHREYISVVDVSNRTGYALFTRRHARDRQTKSEHSFKSLSSLYNS